MSTPRFTGGVNIAMKIPVADYDATVAFYRDTLGLDVEEVDDTGSPTVSASHVLTFGPCRLWLDRVDTAPRSDVWLEVATDDLAQAVGHLAEAGTQTCDEVEPLDTGDAHWIRNPAGRPHVAPVLAVVSGDTLHFAAGPGTQKARNLARDARLTITGSGPDLDVTVEGVAEAVHDDDSLTAVADAYVTRYGRAVGIEHGRFHAEGAPTAGPPPHDVYRVVPHRAFGFPTTGQARPPGGASPPDHRPSRMIPGPRRVERGDPSCEGTRPPWVRPSAKATASC